MTKQDKQLLLKDLCGRLYKGVFLRINKRVKEKLYRIDNHKNTDDWFINGVNIDLIEIKAYLRPMSSMTEEEREHLQTLHDIISDENYGDGFSPAAWEAILDFNNYCREHHLDNGGLITLGLALEAPEGMYK